MSKSSSFVAGAPYRDAIDVAPDGLGNAIVALTGVVLDGENQTAADWGEPSGNADVTVLDAKVTMPY